MLREELAAQVLVVGHHGSRTSSRRAFLDAVGASVFVVSSGPKKYRGVVLPDTDVIANSRAEGSCFGPTWTMRRVPRMQPRLVRTQTGSPAAATTSGCSLAVRRLCRCRCSRVLIRRDALCEGGDNVSIPPRRGTTHIVIGELIGPYSFQGQIQTDRLGPLPRFGFVGL